MSSKRSRRVSSLPLSREGTKGPEKEARYELSPVRSAWLFGPRGGCWMLDGGWDAMGPGKGCRGRGCKGCMGDMGHVGRIMAFGAFRTGRAGPPRGMNGMDGVG